MAGTPVSPTVWTSGRKWAGNLIPLAFWLPPTAFGIVRMVNRAEIDNLGVQAVVLGVVLGWLATNWFGAMPNAKMGRQLQRILKAKGVDLGPEPWLVGFATPRYSSALDPHEDVGYLAFHDQELIFASESRTLQLARIHVKAVRFRPNVHTLVGLGRWVSVDGEIDGTPVRLLLEPRTRGTLVGNLIASGRLARLIREWAKGQATA